MPGRISFGSPTDQAKIKRINLMQRRDSIINQGDTPSHRLLVKIDKATALVESLVGGSFKLFK